MKAALNHALLTSSAIVIVVVGALVIHLTKGGEKVSFLTLGLFSVLVVGGLIMYERTRI